jgi:hypothetical protein
MDHISPYLAPLFGLAGTVLVVGFGYYQWQKQHGNANRGAVAESRKKACEAVWSKLEELNLRLRAASSHDTPDLALMLKEVNAVFLANSFYLDEGQQVAINDYVKALRATSELIGDSDDEAKDEWRNTGAMPLDVSSPPVRAALETLSALRAVVKDRLLQAAGGA